MMKQRDSVRQGDNDEAERQCEAETMMKQRDSVRQRQ